MRRGSQDKDDSKEKNKMMMTKKMRSELQYKSDGEDFATTKNNDTTITMKMRRKPQYERDGEYVVITRRPI